MSAADTRPWAAQYLDDVPLEIGAVTESLSDMIDASVGTYAARPALEFFGARTTYAELGDRISRAAEGLRRLGVSAGDRVALVLPNCPQHVIAFYAVLRLGAIVVEHNPLYTDAELRAQFEDHGATVAIVWDQVGDTVAAFADAVALRHTISVDLTTALPLSKRFALRLPVSKARESRAALTSGNVASGATTWRALLRAPRIAAEVPRPAIDDIAVIQYTSGTTGTPKGAVLTHGNLRANASQSRAWVPGLREGEETFYGVLPLFHVYGMTLGLTIAMSIGANLVLFPKFDIALVKDAARTSPPTFLPAVPGIYDALSRASSRGELDVSSIRFSISGAMSLPAATIERWEKETGGVLIEGYGMTECSPIVLGNPMSANRRAGTVGIPFPSTEMRVVDPEDPTVEVAGGERGELLIRGPQVFTGYWQKPEETAKTLLPGGWIRTGDIVTASPDGFVTIVDRLKDLVITGGYNVSPSEVEAVLLRHPDVLDATVVGLPRSAGDEDVAAAVVLREGATFDQNALRDFCRDVLAAYKVPRRLVEVSELPRSLVGKVVRRAVREQLLNLRTKTAEAS